MDVRDYIRMLKRGWPWITLSVVVFAGLTALYLSLSPKQYQATSVLLLTVKEPLTISDLEQGAALANRSAPTFAQIIDSRAVLEQARGAMGTDLTVEELASMVTATARPSTPLIDISVSGPAAAEVADVADATAQAAIVVLPTLQGSGAQLMNIGQILPAVEPTSPVSPDVSRTMTIGVLLGLIIGLALTIAMQALDTRIRRLDDLRRLCAVPVLAVVPKTRGRAALLVDAPADSAPVVEAFRVLRTNVLFSHAAERRSLMLTSVSDSADASVVPANLAWSLAEAGYSVVLVDLDLRSAVTSDLTGTRSEVGIADVLTGAATILDVPRRTAHPNLHVVGTGNASTQVTELLGDAATKAAIAALESRYQFVIVSAPSVAAYSDAAVLSTVVGATLLSVSAGRTRAVELESALTVLSHVGVVPLGLVLTRVSRSAMAHPPRGGNRGRFRATRGQMRRIDWDRDLVEAPATETTKPTTEATV